MSSLLWKHFIKTPDGGLCKDCKKILKSKNTTTNIHNHLTMRMLTKKMIRCTQVYYQVKAYIVCNK